MIFIVLDSTDCYYNLAAEEYFLKNSKEDVFMLWQNDNTIVVGKNQNTIAEIDSEFVKEQGIHVVRRQTGGGAVYHDLGNLNFSFITKSEGEWKRDFSTFNVPVVSALRKLGVPAECSGRNDITVEGRKISGNAQTVTGGRILHHGTLLFDSNMQVLSRALKPDEEKIRSKGVKSVSARVANISEFLNRKVEVSELIERIYDEVCSLNKNIVKHSLTDIENEIINKLADDKYRTWKWNFGYSPKYSFHQKKRFDGGTIEVYLDVWNGVVSGARIYGDFFGVCDINDMETALIGVRHNSEDIKAALSKIKISDYIGNISLDDILQVLL